MKKALLVLGFALCASFAFAQTGNFALPKSACKVTVEGPKAAAVDYKASIFTKSDTVLEQFTFAANAMDGIVYGAAGHMQGGEVVYVPGTNGQFVADTMQAHGQDAAFSHWMRLNDSADIYTNSNYSSLAAWMKDYITDYMGARYAGNDDGYMLMTCRAPHPSGVHNAFFSLRGVAIPENVAVIDVAFLQSYANFYDECYIDYKVGSNWYAREINVDGIDVDINYLAARSVKFTMPLPLAGEDTAFIRFRWYSSGQRSNSYGYFWAIDNVTIIGGEADRWYTNDQKYLDGAYGTMPEGMSIPMGWFGNVYNNGANARTGINLTMEHLAADRTTSDPIVAKTVSNFPANPTARRVVTVDERGFISGEIANDNEFVDPDDYDWLGWWWRGDNYASENITGYGLQGLPTDDLGVNFVTANLTSPGVDAAEWDTIAYNVVDETGGEEGLAISGYRWAHDNGVIPSQSLYGYGFVNDNGTWYITDTGNYDHEGYMIWLRYTTGNDIPEGTVLRGLEIVPNTVNDIDGIVGTDIIPMCRIATRSEQGLNYVSFEDVNTGASSTVPYTIQESDCNILPTGFIAPGESYNAVNIRFYAQPELIPNTSYYIGYRMASNGKFSPAQTSYRYAVANGRQSYWGTPELRNYHSQFTANTYDLYVYDPDAADNVWAGAYHPYFPMIRPIIGQPTAIDTQVIRAECGTGVTIEDESGEVICGGQTTVYLGGAAGVYVFPQGGTRPEGAQGAYDDTATGCYIIDDIYINNQLVDLDNLPANVEISEGRYDVYNADSSRILQTRFYYAVGFSNISSDNVVRATAHWDVFHPVEGIDPVAATIGLGLQPNPATSSVMLNVKGVTGMVNCSIIDMSGRVVYNADINAGQPTTIDLSGIAAGAYFVRVTNDEFSTIEKLIVR